MVPDFKKYSAPQVTPWIEERRNRVCKGALVPESFALAVILYSLLFPRKTSWQRRVPP
jgi:hypothetical protein